MPSACHPGQSPPRRLPRFSVGLLLVREDVADTAAELLNEVALTIVVRLRLRTEGDTSSCSSGAFGGRALQRNPFRASMNVRSEVVHLSLHASLTGLIGFVRRKRVHDSTRPRHRVHDRVI